MVAPRAGAWIETNIEASMQNNSMSRPARARGLKPYYYRNESGKINVAPRAGAWIETLPTVPSPLM